jgi:hypothetical protein
MMNEIRTNPVALSCRMSDLSGGAAGRAARAGVNEGGAGVLLCGETK